MSKFVVLVALVACGVLVAPAFVSAQETVHETVTTSRAKPISAGLLIGYGTDLGEDFNPWGLGVGVRGGYNLERWYFGGRFVYHFGSSVDLATAGLTTAEYDFNLWEFSAEAGYDFPLEEKLTLRPSLLLGIVSVISSTDAVVLGAGGSTSSSDVKLLISPGASLFYDITPEVFIGGDVRLPFVAGGGTAFGFVIYANGGLHF